MPTFIKRLIGLVIVVLLLVAANAFISREGLFGFGVPYYYGEILNLTGISIILAVSLNLITGFTGQFSIGHAGFMAVGGFSSPFLSVYYAGGWGRPPARGVGASGGHAASFLLGLFFCALVSALAGVVCGTVSFLV